MQANKRGTREAKGAKDPARHGRGSFAHALLFQGRYSEALAIYRQYWDKPLHEKTFGEVTLEDFAAFDKRATPIPTCPG